MDFYKRERLNAITKNLSKKDHTLHLKLLEAIDKNDIEFINKNLRNLLKIDENVSLEFGPPTTLLCRACTNGNIEAVKALIANSADLNQGSGSGNRRSPLQISIELNHIQNAAFLIESGAKITSGLFNAFHETCRHGQHELVALILKKGIDIHMTNKDGDTALHHAVRNAKIEVCKLLIKSNCDLDRKNCLGNTALHEAYQVKCLNVRIQMVLVKLLLENGACPTIENEAGYTPKQLCHNDEISSYFLLNEEHISVYLKKQLYSNEEIKPKTNHQSIEKLKKDIVELDTEIEKLKLELQDAKRQVDIDKKSYRLSHENEKNIQRILRRKNDLRKKMNQKLSHSINPKNSFLLETFFNVFLRCFR